MTTLNPRHLAIGLAMLIAAALAIAITPREKIADHGPKVDLETMIPKQFGEWRMDDSIVPIQISPDVQAALSKIYNQTLARTYINQKGERIMLSIAYGADQGDNVQVHMPEGCYAGQGFAVGQKTKGVLETRFGKLPIARLEATKGGRFEPIAYWVVVGEQVATNLWDMKKVKLRLSLMGEIADGLLIRLSSINVDSKHGFEIQRDFTDAMLTAMPPKDRVRLIGSGKS